MNHEVDALTQNDRIDAEAEAVSEETETAELEGAARNTSRKLLTLLIVGALLLVAIHVTPWGQKIRDWDTLAGLFKGGGLQAEVFFVLISASLMMLGVPRLLFCALAGFAFGFWEGLLWSMVGSLIGSYTAFIAARWGARDWLTARFGQRRFFGRIVHTRPTVMSVVLVRMLPVSNAIINFGLALSRVGSRIFLFGSLIGFLPQGVIAVVIGSGLATDVPWASAAQIGIAAVLLLATIVWTSRHRRTRR
ncbi:MAG: VTT domain-containing protein [Propionivibrio sp.]